jgi:hypothetical protein
VSTAHGTWHPGSSRGRCACGGVAGMRCGGWRPSPYTRPLDVFGRPPAMARLATVAQRTHECGAARQLPGALRELLG